MMDTLIVSERTHMSETGERRALPTTTIQAAGQAIGDVTSGLSRTPLMLAVIMLNCIGIAAAVYFLNLLISGQQGHLRSLLEVQQGQFKELIVMHKSEFDALLAMVPRESPPMTPIPRPEEPTRRAR
jgi:hypothetical protein